MVTFDIGLIENFSIIFTWLFFFVTLYAILSYSKIFGDNKSLQAIMALALSFFSILSPNLIKLVSLMAPAFVVVMIFLTFLFVIYKMFGVEESWISKAVVGDEGAAFFWIIIVSILIIITSAAIVWGPSLPYTKENVSVEPGTISGNIAAVMFHPKFLGFFFLLLIAVFSIWLLTLPPGKS